MKGKGKSRVPPIFPPAARRMDTLNDLLAASDLISLHCSLTDDTMHLLNADRLRHIKPGRSTDGNVLLTCSTCFIIIFLIVFCLILFYQSDCNMNSVYRGIHCEYR